NPEIEFLDALRLFDSPEIAEIISLQEAKKEYLEVLRILKSILQFYQTNIISSGCELLDNHYKVEIKKEKGLEELAGYMTKHNSKLYVCDYCVSYQTHDSKIDAQHMKDCEGINTPVQKTVMLL
ncbi:18479_t:CDS:2, partial [Racocetra fulgida]